MDNKQTEFINRVKREQISLRAKLLISFYQGKIKYWSKKVFFYHNFYLRQKKWVCGLSNNLVKHWA